MSAAAAAAAAGDALIHYVGGENLVSESGGGDWASPGRQVASIHCLPLVALTTDRRTETLHSSSHEPVSGITL